MHSLVPPFRTENIQPDKFRTTSREFNSGCSRNSKSSHATTRQARRLNKLSQLNERNLGQLEQAKFFDYDEQLQNLTSDMRRSTSEWKQRFDNQDKPIYAQQHIQTTTPYRKTWKTLGGLIPI